MKIVHYEALHYTIFPIIPSLLPYQVQIFSSAPCFQSQSVLCLTIMWNTTCHTYTEHEVNL